MKGFLLGPLAVLSATILVGAFAQSAEADELAIYERRPNGKALIGRGYIEYDKSYVDKVVSDWIADWEYCERTQDDNVCGSLESGLDLYVPISEARLRMYGHTFVTDNLSLKIGYEWIQGPTFYDVWIEAEDSALADSWLLVPTSGTKELGRE